jgi:S-DNA-T family DNA segregation ATPase FtsK/SpoIIIE
MLFFMTGEQRPRRVHGPLVTEEEVEAVVEHLRAQGEPDYLEEITEEPEGGGPAEALDLAVGDGRDELYARAVRIVLQDRKASTSYLQRKLQIGYNNAARLIERMEAEGIVSAPDHVGRRRILVAGGDGEAAADHM